jgi:hypothetical protein
MTPGFLPVTTPNFVHGGSIGAQPISDDHFRLAVSLRGFLEEFQCWGLVSAPFDKGFQHLAFVIHGTP